MSRRRAIDANAAHPFQSTYSTECTLTRYPEWKPCAAGPDDPIHDGSRPQLGDLEFPPPPCPICQEDLTYDDGWTCWSCRASWDSQGQEGDWHAPGLRCGSVHRPYKNEPATDLENYTVHCIWAKGHGDGNAAAGPDLHGDGDYSWTCEEAEVEV